jgi:uncharacterized membrane protein YozB (DUF420 family)
LSLDDLPALNAALNGTVAVVILFGRRFAKTHRVAAHRACMLTAVALSTVFLASYVVYHSQRGVTYFPGSGLARAAYFAVLGSHTPLAASLLPLLGVALWHAVRGNIEKHRRIVRWAFPIWLYVSVTGVLVYLMLYKIPW